MSVKPTAATEKYLKRFLQDKIAEIEEPLIFNLDAMVSLLENHAKESRGYSDNYTLNLLSSIGGVLLKDGKPITYSGFQGETEGKTDGKAYIDSLISGQDKGYVILIVAGMEYASFVENYHGLNVLKKTELKMRAEMPQLIQAVIKQVQNAKN